MPAALVLVVLPLPLPVSLLFDPAIVTFDVVDLGLRDSKACRDLVYI